MDKRKLVLQFVAQLEADLAALTQAALASYEAATHAESKPEDEYDTRGLEASYLAGAQSKRAMELEELVALFKYTDLQNFKTEDRIASTALIDVESDGKISHYLMMPKGGGRTETFEGKRIQVVTPISPLGEALLGRKVGDQIEVRVQKVTKDLEIVAVS